MIVLLAPSKTMDFELELPNWLGESEVLFPEEARNLVNTCVNLDDFNKTFSVSDKLGAKTLDELKAWGSGPKRQAFWAYRGDVYDGLKIDDFNEQDAQYAVEVLRVISGLYGYVRPLDMIERYRLEMKTRISGDWGKDLYAFWGQKIADALLAEGPDCLINSTSEEYMKVLRPYLPADLPIIRPKYLQRYPDGDIREGVVFTKRARGAIGHYIVKNRVKSVDDLRGFNEAEYIFDETRSTELEPVFIRDYSESVKSI